MPVALFHSLLPLLMLSFLLSPAAATTTQHQAPTPEPWPEQFHAVLFMNYSNDLSLVDLWYDWPGGRNLHIIKDQLGGPRLFDLEWNNGTSFFYHKEEPLSCRSVQLDVGLLTPNWLDGATYLGRARVDSFLCDAWTKADFIWYYQDVDTKRPVKWVFYTGRTAHVITYEVGAVLEDSAWQTPAYCFQKNNTTTVQQLENPEMFPFHNGLSINHNLIRQKTMFRRSLGS